MKLEDFKKRLTEDEFNRFMNNYSSNRTLAGYIDRICFYLIIKRAFNWYTSAEGWLFWEKISRRTEPLGILASTN